MRGTQDILDLGYRTEDPRGGEKEQDLEDSIAKTLGTLLPWGPKKRTRGWNYILNLKVKIFKHEKCLTM